MTPRVLVVSRPFVGDDAAPVEQVVAPHGGAVADLLGREHFGALVLDLDLPPLDGWVVLAEVGAAPLRPRIVARVSTTEAARRAVALGADVCVTGTDSTARVLALVLAETFSPAMGPEEQPCLPSRATSFPAPTTSGAPV